jgi:formylglycine-generating enzyme required for sulfatase activity
MTALPGGTFTMGSDRFYPEEAPRRQVRVDRFWIDTTPVTNAQFAAFVEATGHRTLAELPLDPADYAGMLDQGAAAGSLVFQRTATPVHLDDYGQWWRFVTGADWRHPLGPDSDLEGLSDHPVVHVAHADAQAYASWCGKSLPTEAEWEYAAWGGREGVDYAWGDMLAPEGRMMANYWQGLFPFSNLLLDGWERTSPAGAFPPNDFGLYDMIGNVWEWTSDWYGLSSGPAKPQKGCCIPVNPRGGRKHESLDPAVPGLKLGRRVLKGGSHLCAESYCQRYRPAARHPQAIDSSTGHIGFRCVVRVE